MDQENEGEGAHVERREIGLKLDADAANGTVKRHARKSHQKSETN